MSHNIEYFTYPLNISKEKVKKELDGYVARADWQEGCTGLFRPIRWIENPVYESHEEAAKAIDRMDTHNYDQIAVRYKYKEMKPDAKYDEMSKKADELYKEYNKRDKKLYAETLTSDFIGCKECGSRLNRKMLKSNFCPVCEKDLRPEYMKKSIQTAKDKWVKAKDSAAEYLQKKAKAEIMWIVKIEYHT